jgi:hypothetical protein
VQISVADADRLGKGSLMSQPAVEVDLAHIWHLGRTSSD